MDAARRAWAQCDAHGRSATRMGAVRRAWAQCDAHGRSATDSDYSLPPPPPDALLTFRQLTPVRRAPPPRHLPSGPSSAVHAVAQPRHLPSDALPRHLPSDALPPHHPSDALPRHLPSDALPRHLPSDALPRHLPSEAGQRMSNAQGTEHGQALQLLSFAGTNEDPTNSIPANNKALCLMYGRDLATAVRVWEHGQALQLVTAVTKEDLTNSIAANNKALCLMYGRDLATAVRVLEDQLQASPLTAVDETVVLNPCSMYELAASDTLNAKSTLSNWLTRLAPDDFDFACTRL
ncbi:unnamed protein product [Closterium sp. Naga37s-1]|nr:unnamed protein product [Closterium sp. Naga37s-1]